MRDRIMFNAERRQNRVIATCCGRDSRGERFEFAVDPTELHLSLIQQASWAAHVATVDRLLGAFVAAGVDAEKVWPILEQVLPVQMCAHPAGPNSTVERLMELSDEMLQGHHNPVG